MKRASSLRTRRLVPLRTKHRAVVVDGVPHAVCQRCFRVVHFLKWPWHGFTKGNECMTKFQRETLGVLRRVA